MISLFRPRFAVAVITALAGSLSPARAVPVLPDDRPGSTVILLGVEAVRDDLNLTPRQRKALDLLRTQYRTAARKVVAGAGTTTESKRAAQAKLDAVTDRYDGEAVSELTAKQAARLTQIEHQVLAGHMLLAPAVQTKLKLTPAQKGQLAKIYGQQQTRAAEVNGWYESGDVGNYERLLYLREDRQSRSDAMVKVLTPAQRSALEALEGEAFFKTAS